MSRNNSLGLSKKGKVVFVTLSLLFLVLGITFGIMFHHIVGDSKKDRNLLGESLGKNSVSEVADRVDRSETRTNNEQQVEKEVKMVTVASKKQRETELKKKIAEAMNK